MCPNTSWSGCQSTLLLCAVAGLVVVVVVVVGVGLTRQGCHRGGRRQPRCDLRRCQRRPAVSTTLLVAVEAAAGLVLVVVAAAAMQGEGGRRRVGGCSCRTFSWQQWRVDIIQAQAQEVLVVLVGEEGLVHVQAAA